MPGKKLISALIFYVLFSLHFNVAYGDYILENKRLRAAIEPNGCIIGITDKASGELFSTEQSTAVKLKSSEAVDDSCYLTYDVFPGEFEIRVLITLDDNSVVFRLSAEHDTTLPGGFKFPGPIESRDGDYYIIPYASGYISPVTEPCRLGSPWGSYHMWAYKGTMPFSGITNLDSGYLITSDDPWDTEISIAKPSWNSRNYTIMPIHHPSMGTFGYDRTFYYTFFDHGGYVAMCDWYRGHAERRGYVRTLREKALDNPDIDKLIGAVDFWAFSSYWSDQLIESMYDYGFDKVLYTFRTNYISFPDNSKVIKKAHDTGFLTSRYDCFTDVYPPGEHPEINWLERTGYPENIIINADGSFRGGWITYLSDGTAFQCGVSCSKTHDQYARRKISRDLAVNNYSARFIDVELASGLNECYSEVHPASRHDDAVYRSATLGIVKDEYGLVTGSEEARDWAFANCDYGEGTMTLVAPDNAGYDWSKPLDEPGERFIDISMNAARRVPLHGLVYHDCHVPTWYTGDGATKVTAYWDHKDLFTVLYGTMQLFMPLDMDHWEENLDHFVTSYQMTNAVFRNVGYERMTSHEMLTSDFLVQKSTFANGWIVVANFSASDYSYEGKTIPPMGFFAGKGDEYAMKIEENGGTYTAVSLENRLFLNPYGRQTAFRGIRTQKPVFLRKDEDNRIHLAFIDSAQSVDFKPGELPWPAESIRVYDDSGEEVATTDVGNGWQRVLRPAKSHNLTIEYEPAVSVENTADTAPEKPSLAAYPNPFNPTATVSYTVTQPGMVTVEIFNLVGQKVATLADSEHLTGSYHAVFDGGRLTSGIYFARMRTGEYSLTRKMLLVK